MNQIVAALLEHKLAVALALFAGSGLGAHVFARILNALPTGPWLAFCRATCARISAIGNASLFRPLYEPFETFFQGLLVETVKAMDEGFDGDDGTDGQKQVAPPQEINPPTLPVAPGEASPPLEVPK